VGYTNAGKTTLFNALTGEQARASDALFVTLDPLVRRLKMAGGRQVLLSDTVGFIDRLPHSIVAAFRATLEEAADADLLLHVVDGAAIDRERRIETVRQVLADIGAAKVPVIEAFNKCDLLDAAEERRVRAVYPAAHCISARRGDGRTELLHAIASRLALDTARVSLEFDASDAAHAALTELYRYGRVLRQLTVDGRLSIEADIPRRVLPRFEEYRVRQEEAGR
jgi:GTP-binding protein HflX